MLWNSTLRVERRMWGNSGEREGRRTRSKVIASCRAREWEPVAEGRGFLPREITLSRDHLRRVMRTLREFAWRLSPRGACTILPDEDMEISGLSDCNYWWHAGGGRGGGESTGGEWRAGRGLQGDTGAKPPDYHETNLKCFMNKFYHEMRHDLWR